MPNTRNDFQTYKVEALAKDQGRWRIDWFGAVTYAERYRRPSQPLIEIQLSKVPDALANAEDIFKQCQGQRATTKQVRLPVGFLPMLAIGDIWQDGKLIESPSHDIEEFSLQVGRHNSILIKAGLPDEDSGEYYLPNAQHPYHMQNTQSYCVRVKSEIGIIIVPAVELLRFYFGSSSALVSRLFDAPFIEENFWSGLDALESDTPRIHLAPGISGRSASDIGRIALCKNARAAAELVGNSCIAATSRGERAYPKAVFPFEGVSHIVASGKWLSFGGKNHGVFLVFRLRSCSYPFPFKRLRYTSERAQKKEKNPDRDARTSTSLAEMNVISSRRQMDSKTLCDAEPLKAKTARDIQLFRTRVKFLDLLKKPITKVEDETTPTLMMTQKGLSFIDSSSVGDAGRDPTVQPIQLAVNAADAAAAGTCAKEATLSVLVFFEILFRFRRLNAYQSIETVRLNPRQRFDHLSTMPQMIDEDGEISSVCIVTEYDGQERITTRNRRISIGLAAALYSSCYILVPEPQNGSSQIELHVILDLSRSIRTLPDLMAAMAKHFLFSPIAEKPYELNVNVISMQAISINHTESPQVIADVLLAKALSFIKSIGEIQGIPDA